ncbi:MAG: heavy metal-binding domain-containing protein [Flectobacillus sp.]|uniref:heavy metal-binding domain-containing protein n=1 Tax=Flectobacillus sp. TaxID=50419 RepID=UPI003B9CB844
MENFTHCPNCDTNLKPNRFNTVVLCSETKAALINEYLGKTSLRYCEKCGRADYTKAYNMYIQEKNDTINKLSVLIHQVPIITINSPFNWEYDVIDIITSQSVMGTGVLTEISSSFSDLFGAKSESLSQKLKDGENFCKAQLRKQAIELGANAIIATDIDYSEVGGAKAMLMVCMSGTAIKLKNIHAIGKERMDSINELIQLNKRIASLHKYANLSNVL